MTLILQVLAIIQSAMINITDLRKMMRDTPRDNRFSQIETPNKQEISRK